MASRTVVRWTVLSILTLGLAASVGIMFAVRGGFDATWMYASLALYGTALLVYWLIGAGSKPKTRMMSDDEMERRMSAALAGAAPKAPTEISAEPELVVEPSRTEPIAPMVAPKPEPAGFTFKGFTLYQRGDSRFFSKGTPPGAQAIALPADHEAKWDAKKGKPVLVAITQPWEEEAEVAIVQDTKKNCSAMIAPGEFCDNIAKDGSKYCARHANYRGAEDFFEVRKDIHLTKPGKVSKVSKPKLSTPVFETRVAKPPVRKPLKFKSAAEPRFEVKVAKLSNTKQLSSNKSLGFEAPPEMKKAPKPFKPRATGDFQVRVAKPSTEKPLRLRFTEPVVKTAKPPQAKPLKLRSAPEPIVKVSTGAPAKAKGKQFKASELEVKVPGQMKPAKPMRVAERDFTVRDTKSAKPVKPIKVSPTEFTVRDQKAGRAVKPLRTQEPEILVVRDTKRRTETPAKGRGR